MVMIARISLSQDMAAGHRGSYCDSLFELQLLAISPNMRGHVRHFSLGGRRFDKSCN